MDARIKSGHDKCVRQNNTTGKSIPIYGNRVKPRNKKYFAFPEVKIKVHDGHPVPLRGALAIVATRDGLQWTPMLRQTSAAEAYGEVVWS